MKKLFIIALLSLTVALSAACSSKMPDTGEFECEFDQETKTAVIVGYNGKDESVVIPDSFGKYTVTSIGRNAFKENYDITEITFPDTLKSIGASAFELCISLEEVNFPESLETVGNTAFANCRGLETVLISSNVKSIGICAFTGCTDLETFAISKNNEYYNADDGVLYNKDRTKLIQYPLGNKKESYEMPQSVEKIASYAFEKAQYLETLTCSENLKTVESYSFQASSIKEIVFGNSLEELGGFCFNESKLTSIELGSSVKKIGESAFAWCTSLGGISLPATVEEIGVSAFYMCTSVTEYKVAEENKSFSSDEQGVLFNKDKTKLIYYPVANLNSEYTVPNTATEISANAFSPCLGLTKITIPDSVETVGERAFAQCANLKDIVYEGTKPQNIAKNAFEK